MIGQQARNTGIVVNGVHKSRAELTLTAICPGLRTRIIGEYVEIGPSVNAVIVSANHNHTAVVQRSYNVLACEGVLAYCIRLDRCGIEVNIMVFQFDVVKALCQSVCRVIEVVVFASLSLYGILKVTEPNLYFGKRSVFLAIARSKRYRRAVRLRR